MPVYEFRCNDTGRHFEKSFKTIADYEAATIKSPFTGSTNISRIIRSVSIKKSSSAPPVDIDRLEAGDIDALEQIGDDPRAMGQTLRYLSEQTGEDMGPEFGEVVERLESGQGPDEIESSMSFDDSPPGDAGTLNNTLPPSPPLKSED